MKTPCYNAIIVKMPIGEIRIVTVPWLDADE